ncbi:MAG: 16S rRNA (cytidine(1402)-2'-O)-methyltransferase [Desulfobacteraceae bacterium]|nr:16S rRNA (cytidine(1402)-2'-O)-methyltransferase [Desulfobacteraceae bacterium]
MLSKPASDERQKEAGKLFLVATPIGNLADITLRALETLRSVDLIAAEDTRHTRKLLSHYDIHVPLISYHEHNARERGPELVGRISAGQSVAVVTDAGTPGISDPGSLLVESALAGGIEPVIIPGPSAPVAALVISGLPTHPFAFLGFPPARGRERKAYFEQNAAAPMTLVLFESPKRLAKSLAEMLQAWGDRRIAVVRELTKIHEEVFRGRISEAEAHFGEEVRGELVLVVEGHAENTGEIVPEDWQDELKRLIAMGSPSKEAAAQIANRFGLPRRTVYQAALAIRQDAKP